MIETPKNQEFITPPTSSPPTSAPATDTQFTAPPPVGIITKNGQKYIFDIGIQDGSKMTLDALKSKAGRAQGSVKVNPNVINELVIEDDIFSWYSQGYMIYIDNYNAAHGFESGNSKGPTFRLDARDMLLIGIMPVILGDINNKLFSKEVWMLDYEFVIYDTEDMPVNDEGYRLKKVYFRDIRAQLMSELNLEFSTATLPGAVGDMVTTGAAISGLLTKANSAYNLGKVNELFWEDGYPIFYTSPANYRVTDDLEYLLQRHVSKRYDNDMCLFSSDRYTKDFTLTTYSDLFFGATEGAARFLGAKPGKNQIEHLYIQSPTLINQNNGIAGIGIQRVPISTGSGSITLGGGGDINLDNFSLITKYNFVEMSGNDNAMALTNRPVYSYDFKNKQFQMEIKKNTADATKTYLNKNYIAPLYAKTATPLMPLNLTKKTFLNVQPEYSTKVTKEQRLNDGRNKTLYAAIYLNECINFKILGVTKRVAGKFIGIDRLSSNTNETDFENRALGQWLVTKITHVFTQNDYINEIVAVKINAWQDLKINENIW